MVQACRKTNYLLKRVGLIDGNVMGIAHTNKNMLHNVAYNGHNRKHSMNVLTVTSADGTENHSYGPLESFRKEWKWLVK